VFAGRPVVARAVRVGTAAGLYRPFGGEQRGVDVLTDVLDVGRALQHVVVAAAVAAAAVAAVAAAAVAAAAAAVVAAAAAVAAAVVAAAAAAAVLLLVMVMFEMIEQNYQKRSSLTVFCMLLLMHYSDENWFPLPVWEMNLNIMEFLLFLKIISSLFIHHFRYIRAAGAV
jgi:hypothetical protein